MKVEMFIIIILIIITLVTSIFNIIKKKKWKLNILIDMIILISFFIILKFDLYSKTNSQMNLPVELPYLKWKLGIAIVICSFVYTIIKRNEINLTKSMTILGCMVFILVIWYISSLDLRMSMVMTYEEDLKELWLIQILCFIVEVNLAISIWSNNENKLT